MKEKLLMEKSMAKVPLLRRMVINMKVNIKMTKEMVKAPIL
jgi:hypothetical protein